MQIYRRLLPLDDRIFISRNLDVSHPTLAMLVSCQALMFPKIVSVWPEDHTPRRPACQVLMGLGRVRSSSPTGVGSHLSGDTFPRQVLASMVVGMRNSIHSQNEKDSKPER